MSFLDFYQYLGLFSMDGRHVPLWERDSACGRGILPVEEVFCLWKRDSACGREILPVEERFSLWRRCIPLGETYPYGWALFPEKNEHGNPKNSKIKFQSQNISGFLSNIHLLTQTLTFLYQKYTIHRVKLYMFIKDLNIY